MRTRRNPARRVRWALVFVSLTALLCPACRAPLGWPGPTVEELDVDGREAGWLALPAQPVSLKLAVIGDSGRGTREQREVAAQMVRYRERFRFGTVLMLGDNIYEGPATREDYRTKFEEPYRELLSNGVRFFAVLGNHDDPGERDYPPFGMGGQRYYTFELPGGVLAPLQPKVRIFALDSTRLDPTQYRWLSRELARADADWRIVLLHHPLYSSGRYARWTRVHRWALEELFVRHGVNAVFSGHEHLYERTRLMNGIQYFISGAAGSLRRGDARPDPHVARSYDDDYHFMLVELTRRKLYFQAVTRTGVTVDAGVLSRGEEPGRETDAPPITTGTRDRRPAAVAWP